MLFSAAAFTLLGRLAAAALHHSASDLLFTSATPVALAFIQRHRQRHRQRCHRDQQQQQQQQQSPPLASQLLTHHPAWWLGCLASPAACATLALSIWHELLQPQRLQCPQRHDM